MSSSHTFCSQEGLVAKFGNYKIARLDECYLVRSLMKSTEELAGNCVVTQSYWKQQVNECYPFKKGKSRANNMLHHSSPDNSAKSIKS